VSITVKDNGILDVPLRTLLQAVDPLRLNNLLPGIQPVLTFPMQWDAPMQRWGLEAGHWERALSTRKAPVHVSAIQNFAIGNPGWTQVIAANPNRAMMMLGFQTHTNIYEIELDSAGSGSHFAVTFSMGIQMGKFFEYFKGTVYARTTGGAGVCSVVELEYNT
jgi:hypothetical protein